MPAPAASFTTPADGRVFLGRLTHLEPAAVVRLRPASRAPGSRAELWARLPWGVLVTREVPVAAPTDVTVAPAALLAADGRLPPACDHQWRWPLPPTPGQLLEEVPAQVVREVSAAAASTLRTVATDGLSGRRVGTRVLRDALLDHVPITVESPDGPAQVPQRLVQAVVRMGFLSSAPVRVRRAGGWVGLAAEYGTAWWARPGGGGGLPVRPV